MASNRVIRDHLVVVLVRVLSDPAPRRAGTLIGVGARTVSARKVVRRPKLELLPDAGVLRLVVLVAEPSTVEGLGCFVEG